MAKNVLKPEVKMSGLMDIALIGASKAATEQALTPFVGNGSFVSGIVKLGAGGIIQPRGKLGNIVGSGLVLDSIDDLVTATLKMLKVGTTETGDEW